MSLNMNPFFIDSFVNKLFFHISMKWSLSWVIVEWLDFIWNCGENGSSITNKGQFVIWTYWIEHFDLSMHNTQTYPLFYFTKPILFPSCPVFTMSRVESCIKVLEAYNSFLGSEWSPKLTLWKKKIIPNIISTFLFLYLLVSLGLYRIPSSLPFLTLGKNSSCSLGMLKEVEESLNHLKIIALSLSSDGFDNKNKLRFNKLLC